METINPYYIVKTAENFYADEAVAPIIGALLGGGIGAYTGKGWKSKLLRGLAGAGIGGSIGMGANWIRNRLGYGQAADAQRERQEGLDRGLENAKDEYKKQTKGIAEIYNNVGGTDVDQITPDKALKGIGDVINSREVIQRPIGHFYINADLARNISNRTGYDILVASPEQLERENKRIREQLQEPVLYETFTPLNVNPKFTDESEQGFQEHPVRQSNSTDFEKDDNIKYMQEAVKPNQSFYSSDFINPIIGALLGTGIGAYTGKDKKSKIKRGLIGLLLGGGAGLGANWIKDKMDQGEYKEHNKGYEDLLVRNTNTFNRTVEDRNSALSGFYRLLGGNVNNNNAEDILNKLQNYTKDLKSFTTKEDLRDNPEYNKLLKDDPEKLHSLLTVSGKILNPVGASVGAFHTDWKNIAKKNIEALQNTIDNFYSKKLDPKVLAGLNNEAISILENADQNDLREAIEYENNYINNMSIERQPAYIDLLAEKIPNLDTENLPINEKIHLLRRLVFNVQRNKTHRINDEWDALLAKEKDLEKQYNSTFHLIPWDMTNEGIKLNNEIAKKNQEWDNAHRLLITAENNYPDIPVTTFEQVREILLQHIKNNYISGEQGYQKKNKNYYDPDDLTYRAKALRDEINLPAIDNYK